jgi:hypothetical protein
LGEEPCRLSRTPTENRARVMLYRVRSRLCRYPASKASSVLSV